MFLDYSNLVKPHYQYNLQINKRLFSTFVCRLLEFFHTLAVSKNSLCSCETGNMTVKVKWVGRTPQACSESDSYLPNIYEDFLPLAVLCKVSLVLPIRDVFKGMNNLNFNWYSCEVISVLLLSFCISYILPAQIRYENNYHPNLAMESLIYSASNLWFIFGQQLLINLLEKIDQFDHSLNFYSKTSYHKKINKYIWVVMVCIYPVALLSKASLALYRQDPCTEYNCSLIEIVRGFSCYQHNLQMAIFTFFCYEIKMRFQTLNDVFCGFLKKTYQCNPVLFENYPQIEAHRLHYARLIRCTKILNELFGWRFAFMFAAIILFIVSLLYYFHTEEGYVISGYDVMAIFFSLLLLFSLTHNTDLLVVEVSTNEVLLI